MSNLMCPLYLFILMHTNQLTETDECNVVVGFGALETSELIEAAGGGGRGSQHHHHRPSLLIVRAAADAEIKSIFSALFDERIR